MNARFLFLAAILCTAGEAQQPTGRVWHVATNGLAGAATAAERHVVFCVASPEVEYPAIGLDEFGLTPHVFSLGAEELGAKVDLREALDRSRLLVFGPPSGSARVNLDLVFANSANRNAVRSFLNRGGTIVFDGTGVAQGEITGFLAEIGVVPPKAGDLPPLEKKEKHLVTPGPAHKILTTPQALTDELNPKIRSAYSSWDEKQIAPLRLKQNPELAVLVIQENVLGGGRVVFNTTGLFDGRKTDGARLCDNLYTFAFQSEVKRVPPPKSRYIVESGWRAWTKNPYERFSLNQDAAEKSPLDKLELTAAINEHLSAMVLVSNSANAPALNLTVAASELRSATNALPPVVVRELVFDRADGTNPDPLPECQKLSVPPGETRIVWLTVNTFGRTAGNYCGELVLTPDGGTPRPIPLRVEVLPITLPSANPMRFSTWEWFFGWRDKLVQNRDNWKYFHQDLIDHGANVFHAVMHIPSRVADTNGNVVLGPEDFLKYCDRFITLDKQSRYLIYGNIEAPFAPAIKGGSELRFPSPEHAKAYRGYVAGIIKFLKELGLTYDQFAFYPYDEIRDTQVATALKNYAIIKEVDPQAKIFVTLGGKSQANFFESKEGLPVKDIAPFIDIWCQGLAFHEYFANRKSEHAQNLKKVLEFCKQTGKEVWSYNVTTRAAYDLAPYQRYRLKPWGAYALGVTGYGFFGLTIWKGDTFSAILPGPRPVPTIRWEAVRDGLNDVKYLVVLTEEIARAKQAGRPTDRAEALREAALREVNENSLDASLAPAYRTKIASMILELQKNAPARAQVQP